MADAPDLPTLREAIEQADREILALLKRRMDLSEDIARAKLSRASPFRDPEREEKVLRHVRQLAVTAKLDPHLVERLYRLIMEMSVSRQQQWLQTLDSAPLRVAYQGVEGSYSHLAAQQRYSGRPAGTFLTGHETIRQAAQSVRSGDADVALLPLENTTAGSINETYDLLAEGGLFITGERVSPIEHRLLVLPGTRLDQIRTVLSHPQALSQCEAFLRAHPLLRTQAEFDTAGAARRVHDQNDRSFAAIASESAGRRYGLEPLPIALLENAGQSTRFVEVAVEAPPCPPDAPCKTSLLLVLDHRPGALGEVLAHLARQGVNLTKLESRPRPGASFQYRFYLDLEGHAASRAVEAALEEIRPLTSELRVLGTYVAAAQEAR